MIALPWTDLGVLFAANFAIAMSAVLILWAISIPLRDVSIIDMFFAVIVLAITLSSLLLSTGSPGRKWLILTLVAIWALRMTGYLIWRNWGEGEDVRYTKLRSWVADDQAFVWLSLRKVFLLQGLILWAVTLPVQFAMTITVPLKLGWMGTAGVAIWVIGFAFETISDMQLTRHRKNPELAGRVLKTGLWRYSRHPNYFGEICLWWGLFLLACDNPWGWTTVIGPALYTWLIVRVTGKATLEKKLRRERPDYDEYIQSTSGLIPWPPRSERQSDRP